VLNITIGFTKKGFTQEDAGVILRSVAGVKYFFPVCREVYSVVSVPPGNIPEFEAVFYEKLESADVLHRLLVNGWVIEKMNLVHLREHVISVIEKNDIQMINILQVFVCKRIAKIMNDYPTQQDIPPVPNTHWELDDLINLQTLLENKDRLRPALLGVYKYTRPEPTEA
jgi:hypothetical protein